MKVCIVEQHWEDRTITSDWFEVTEEEYNTLRYKYPMLVDYGKDFYLSQALETKEKDDQKRKRQEAARAKQNAEKEAKALERKRKQLEKLKKELEAGQT